LVDGDDRCREIRNVSYDYLTPEENEEFHISGKEKVMKIPYLLIFCTALVVGGALNTGATDAFGQTDEEKTPIADSWQTTKNKIALFADARVKRRQLEVETTKDVVMLPGKVNSDATEPAAEDIAKELDVVKTVKNDPEVVAPSTRETVEESQGSPEFDVKGGTAKFRSLHSGRLKLMIIGSLYHGLMKP
jgi:hypothetical protein